MRATLAEGITVIIFEHVTKRYPGGTIAVDDLSLEVPDGYSRTGPSSTTSPRSRCWMAGTGRGPALGLGSYSTVATAWLKAEGS
jgi:hypothetical protein